MKATDKQVNYFNDILELSLFDSDRSVWEDRRDDCMDDIQSFSKLLDEILEHRDYRREK